MDQLGARFILSTAAFPSQHINLCPKFKCEESVYPSYVPLSLFAGSENCLTSLQVGRPATRALVTMFPNQVFCLKLRLHGYHPCAAGLGTPRSLGDGRSYCPVASGKVTGCWIDLGELTWQASPVVSQCPMDVCRTARLTLSHRLWSHPQGEKQVQRGLAFAVLFQFKHQTAFALPLCRGRQRKAARPAPAAGGGKRGGALHREELVS